MHNLPTQTKQWQKIPNEMPFRFKMVLIQAEVCLGIMLLFQSGLYCKNICEKGLCLCCLLCYIFFALVKFGMLGSQLII